MGTRSRWLVCCRPGFVTGNRLRLGTLLAIMVGMIMTLVAGAVHGGAPRETPHIPFEIDELLKVLDEIYQQELRRTLSQPGQKEG